MEPLPVDRQVTHGSRRSMPGTSGTMNHGTSQTARYWKLEELVTVRVVSARAGPGDSRSRSPSSTLGYALMRVQAVFAEGTICARSILVMVDASSRAWHVRVQQAVRQAQTCPAQDPFRDVQIRPSATIAGYLLFL